MKITNDTIEHIAKLSRLKLSESQKDTLTSEMGNIINYVDKLNELDTKGVEPKSQVIPLQNVFREDVVAESLDKDELLSNSACYDDGALKVPKVV
ncbi:MAG: Asp-tRNA(Asn)/Glu-tRNA(Gln) amidotransferase subunit GatC [Clostridia bacterium]|jgi:aspartyl-tRNA(Asn)/glutamyl-tRNA(Gln) amidotransferase subunit C